MRVGVSVNCAWNDRHRSTDNGRTELAAKNDAKKVVLNAGNIKQVAIKRDEKRKKEIVRGETEQFMVMSWCWTRDATSE